MAITFQKYLNSIRNPIRFPIVKIELLDRNEKVIDDISEDFIDCSISLTLQNGSRRTANLVLNNITGKYTPGYRNSIWLDKKLHLYSGLNIDGEDFFISRGIFTISEPDVSSSFAEKITTLTLLDKWSLLDGELSGELESDYIVNVGTSVISVVKDILTQAGEVKSPIIENTSEVSPYTLTLKAGDTYADMLIKLAGMLSYEVFFDKNGYLRFQKPIDQNKIGESWEFSTEEASYLGSSHKYEFSKVKNKVIVYGDNVLGGLVKATSQDNNLFSPTKYTDAFKRPMVVIDEVISTVSLAQQRSDYELKKAIVMQETVDVKSIAIDFLEEGDVVIITDSSNGLNKDRCQIQTINVGLKYDTEQTMSVWKVRDIV